MGLASGPSAGSARQPLYTGQEGTVHIPGFLNYFFNKLKFHTHPLGTRGPSSPFSTGDPRRGDTLGPHDLIIGTDWGKEGQVQISGKWYLSLFSGAIAMCFIFVYNVRVRRRAGSPNFQKESRVYLLGVCTWLASGSWPGKPLQSDSRKEVDFGSVVDSGSGQGGGRIEMRKSKGLGQLESECFAKDGCAAT